MPVGAADFLTTIQDVWNQASLDDKFKVHWSASDRDRFTVLSDDEAEASQPWPYCVFMAPEGMVTGRMSGGSNTHHFENRTIPATFTIFARTIGDSSSKEIAASLASEIMKVFGGHPEVKSAVHYKDMEFGQILDALYQGEHSIRLGIEQHSWSIRYNFQLDVPVAV